MVMRKWCRFVRFGLVMAFSYAVIETDIFNIN